MNRWFLAGYLAYKLSQNFVNDWSVKIHFFKFSIYDFEKNNDFYHDWSATFRFRISFPRPEIILDSRKGYEVARRIQIKTKNKVAHIVLVRFWGKND
ncbi:hypothetical protein PN488_22325 [Nodularia spumigena CS-591/12]|uniref:hypothetical protein n=1 Tax=Nodularia spumigena TaxID=70799 RepID=UPI0023307307|nr:hypothetical protein [Nodularia spumigena]MDB9307067.1 hypothetical protein [Nodularia spumigena CS-591/12]